MLVDPSNVFSGRRDDFLALAEQKQRMIDLIITEMNKFGIETIQARLFFSEILQLARLLSSDAVYGT